MDLTDLQKLDLKLTTRTALLLKTIEQITDTISRGTATQRAQGVLNDALTARVISLEKRLKILEN
jgi:hypothetical protein